ncbi:MAG: hypothetical protein ABSA57_02720 [Candidatus Acidiferrales bacterium]|jgi:DNA repair exonuclease SbcCD ATPase subunit
MRRFLTFAALAVTIALPTAGWCQQTNADQEKQATDGSQGEPSVPASGSSSQGQGKATVAEGSRNATPAPQPDSIAAAARQAREQKKESSKTPKVFTNDNIPSSGGISSVGEAATATTATDTSAGPAASAANDEKAWRERFAKLNHKLTEDKQDLDVMQRELGVLDVQYYNDPVKAMQQQLTRSDINDKTAKIDEKKKQVEVDQQAIDDAQDELRKSGGDPGWGR